MLSWPAAAANWIGRLFGGKEEKRSYQPGQDDLTTGGLAILATESLMSERFHHLIDPTRTAQEFCQKNFPKPAPTNVFGTPLTETFYPSPREVVGSLFGTAMTGVRASAFLSSDKLLEVHDQLTVASGRRIPAVIHAICSTLSRQNSGSGGDHGGYHAIGDTGVLQFFARNSQEAIDLSIIARKITELALTPGLIAIDGPETAFSPHSIKMTEESVIKEFLNYPDGEIKCPTVAQEMLFGTHRRQVPRWFSLDYPTVSGSALEGQDLAVALAGQSTFFSDHLLGLIVEVMHSFSEITGRTVAPVFEYKLKDADYVCVAQGAITETLQGVVDRLRKEGVQVGVLGLTCLRPFPTETICSLLSFKKGVLVFERTDNPGSPPPLLTDISNALRESVLPLYSAIYGVGGAPVTAKQIYGACQNMVSKAPKKSVRLGIDGFSKKSSFSKREALIQGVERNYGAIGEYLLDEPEIDSFCPPNAKTLALSFKPDANKIKISETDLIALAEVLAGKKRSHIRSRLCAVGSGLYRALITASGDHFYDPGDDIPLDIAILTSLDEKDALFSSLKEKGALIILTSRGVEEVGKWISSSWREEIQKKSVNLYVVDGEISALPELLKNILNDDSELKPVELSLLGAGGYATPVEPPLLLSQIKDSDRSYHNVSRFYGEFLQPRIEGEAPQSIPDPFLSLGMIPAGTAAFNDMTNSRVLVPKFELGQCTGCGECWVSCPDSSIAPIALGLEAILNSAAGIAAEKGFSSQVADKLKRSHRQLATKVDALIAKQSGHLSIEILQEGFEWLLGKMPISDDELPLYKETFIKGTCVELQELLICSPKLFFHDPHKANKGTGTHLIMGFNPQSCQGCGICSSVCDEEVITMVPQTTEMIGKHRESWKVWERTQDTSGENIDDFSKVDEIGPLKALMLSRCCSQVLFGGDGAEPGSGDRIAARQLSAVAEYQSQRWMVEHIQELDQVGQELKDKQKSFFMDSLPVDDLDALDKALEKIPGTRAETAKILATLDEAGITATIDAVVIQKMVRCGKLLDQRKWLLSEGKSGFGRARFGVVFGGTSAGQWKLSFPNNPFQVPVVIDPAGDGATLAAGILEGVLADYTDGLRWIRQAKLLIENPPDLAVKEEALASFTWHDLSPDELAKCPPVILMGGADSLFRRGLTGLSDVFSSNLPLKIVVLDGKDMMDSHLDPTLMGLSHREAFVSSTSIAHPDHLFSCVSGALKFSGPSLIRIHTPSPKSHGFEFNKTMTRAKDAVLSRVNPLFIYDPSEPGVFGTRMKLEANPGMLSGWSEIAESGTYTAADWALGEGRFASSFSKIDKEDSPSFMALKEWLEMDSSTRTGSVPTLVDGNGVTYAVDVAMAGSCENLLNNWTTLQEVAGVVTPFTETVRQQIEAEVASEHEAKIAEIIAQHKVEIEELKATQRTEFKEELRARLVQLSSGTGPKVKE